jgi:hypothetical protein
LPTSLQRRRIAWLSRLGNGRRTTRAVVAGHIQVALSDPVWLVVLLRQLQQAECFSSSRGNEQREHLEPSHEKTASTTRCASVNLDVLRGFEPDVSQSYHNRRWHLAARRWRALVVEALPARGERRRRRRRIADLEHASPRTPGGTSGSSAWMTRPTCSRQRRARRRGPGGAHPC